METKKLISIVHDIVPERSELNFDKTGIIRKPRKDIRRVGVCVDLTNHVMDQVMQQRIDFLIIHHGHGKAVRERIRTLDVGAYGLHLALNVAEEGLIDGLANLIEMVDKEPIPLSYKGNFVGKGALLGYTRSDGGRVYHGQNVHELARRLHRFYCDNLGYDRIRTYGLHLDQTISYVIVSVGSAGREDFIDQILQSDLYRRASMREHGFVPPIPSHLFIAGSASPGAIEMARKNGLVMLTVGDYESRYPGMVRFTSRLDETVRGETRVMFLSNHGSGWP